MTSAITINEWDITTRDSASKFNGATRIDATACSVVVGSALDELIQRNPDATIVLRNSQRANLRYVLRTIQERDGLESVTVTFEFAGDD
jgi:hypothetical protein